MPEAIITEPISPENIQAPAAPASPAPVSPAPASGAPTAPPAGFSWKSQLGPDLANSPTLQKFEDSKEGLSKAFESHHNLEKLLGHEKVPIPKGPEDVEGRARLFKALGVPEKPEGYALPDATIPESLKGLTFDKQRFSEIIHKHNLTPEQAKGVWAEYNQINQELYNNALREQQANLTKVINETRAEWGDTYEANIELGQMVINKFSKDQETNDWATANFAKDPRGIKMLAEIGKHFAENKVGDFTSKRFSLTPAEAQKEIDAVRADKNHPYNNEKAPKALRDQAIDQVNSLYAVIGKSKGQA